MKHLIVLVLTLPAFGQKEVIFKSYFEEMYMVGKSSMTEVEKTLVDRGISYANMKDIADRVVPTNILKEVFEKLWETENRLSIASSNCNRLAFHLRESAASALNCSEISREKYSEAIALAEKMEFISTSVNLSKGQKFVHSKFFSVVFSQAEQIMEETRRAIANRNKMNETFVMLRMRGKRDMSIYIDTILTNIILSHCLSRLDDLSHLLDHAKDEWVENHISEKQLKIALNLRRKIILIKQRASNTERELFAHSLIRPAPPPVVAGRFITFVKLKN